MTSWKIFFISANWMATIFHMWWSSKSSILSVFVGSNRVGSLKSRPYKAHIGFSFKEAWFIDLYATNTFEEEAGVRFFKFDCTVGLRQFSKKYGKSSINPLDWGQIKDLLSLCNEFLAICRTSSWILIGILELYVCEFSLGIQILLLNLSILCQ